MHLMVAIPTNSMLSISGNFCRVWVVHFLVLKFYNVCNISRCVSSSLTNGDCVAFPAPFLCSRSLTYPMFFSVNGWCYSLSFAQHQLIPNIWFIHLFQFQYL
jgi:hypothetical protein